MMLWSPARRGEAIAEATIVARTTASRRSLRNLPLYGGRCSTLIASPGFTPAIAGSRWFSTCSAVAGNFRPVTTP
jgi:hypothetical protein